MNQAASPASSGLFGLPIQLDSGNVLEIPPSGIVYSAPGNGKTCAVMSAFSHALCVQATPTGLRSYASWCRDNWETATRLGLRTPVKPNPAFNPQLPESGMNSAWIDRPWHEGGTASVTIDAFRSDMRTRVPHRQILGDIVQRYVQSVYDGTCPFWGLYFNEFSELAERVRQEIVADSSISKAWGGKITATKEFVFNLTQVGKITRRPVLFECHDVDPKYDMKEGSPTEGDLRYPGGPKLPFGPMLEENAASVDFCIRLVAGGAGGMMLPLMGGLPGLPGAAGGASNASAAPVTPIPGLPPPPAGTAQPAPAAPLAADRDRGVFKSKTVRRWYCQASAEWVTKFRDVSIGDVETGSLRELLLAAGYRV